MCFSLPCAEIIKNKNKNKILLVLAFIFYLQYLILNLKSIISKNYYKINNFYINIYI